jgi:hypothetical protein
MTELPGPGQGGLPVALVTLPDGQQLYAEVLERSQSWDGAWWYRCQLALTRREQQPGAADRAQVVRVEFEVRHPAAEPVPGQDYSWLRGVRQPPGLITVPHRGGRELHREGCWLLDSHPHDAQRVTREQADALLAADTVETCSVCLTLETPP